MHTWTDVHRRCVALLFQFLVATIAIADDSRYTFGLINPETGIFQSLGADCKTGFEFAISELPAELREKVAFRFDDDQSTPKVALSAFEKLRLDKNLLAVSAFSSSAALAVSPLSNRHHVPLLALSGHPDLYASNSYAFSHWTDFLTEISHFIDYATSRNFKRIAIVTTEHDYPLALRELFKKGLEKYSGQIVTDETVQKDADYRSLVTRIIKKDPNLIFLNVFDPAFSQIARLLYEQRYAGKIVSIGGNAGTSILKNAGTQATDGIDFIVIKYNYPFFNALLESHKASPDNVAYTFCCYLGLKRALQAARPLILNQTATPELLYQALLKEKQIETPNHSIKITGRFMQLDFARVTARNGRIEPGQN